MKRLHYAWAVCLACLWMFLCNMGLCSNILTIYLPFLDAGGISDSMGSSILSVRCLFSFLTTFFVERFYARLSLRRGILLASLAGAAAPLVFCVGGSAFVYYLGAALAGVAYGAGCIYPAALLLSNWFHARKGLALGVSSAGSGVATMLFSPLLSAIVLHRSLRAAFLAQAAFMAVSAVAVFLLVRDTPEEKGLAAYGGKNAENASGERAASAPQAPRLLGLLALMMLLNGGAGFAFSGHLSILASTSGYGARVSASAVSLFGLMLIVGKPAAGALADRIGAKACSVLLISVFILGCFFVLGMNGTSLFFCFSLTVMLGAGASVFNVGPPLWAAELSAGGQYAKTLKWLQLFYNLGGIVFTVVPGFIADRTGEYKSAYLLFAAMMAASLCILLRAYRRKRGCARRAARLR